MKVKVKVKRSLRWFYFAPETFLYFCLGRLVGIFIPQPYLMNHPANILVRLSDFEQFVFGVFTIPMANIHNNRHSPVSDVFENGAITSAIGANLSQIYSFIGYFYQKANNCLVKACGTADGPRVT